MKILLANKFFYLNGGSERVFFQERNFLLEKGYGIVDFSMQDARNYQSPFAAFFVPNISYHGTQGIRAKLQQSLSFVHSSVAVENLAKLLKKESPEIAHLHNIYHQLTPSIIPVLKRRGIKVLLTLHDYKLICPSYLTLRRDEICTACDGRSFWKPFTTNCQGSLAKGLLLAAEAFFHKWRKSYEAVDLFISPSRFLADLTGCRIPKEKVRILHNGIDADEYVPSSEDQGYILYFGRLSHEKGIETLLTAHQKIPEMIPLRVVGTGPMEEELRRRFPTAEFLGYRSGEELQKMVQHASFVVVPSKCYENCSMVVLEAMAMGRPVIGSKIGGIPEQVEDGKTGFLFEMGDVPELAEKMKQLWNDEALRRYMGMEARKKLEQEYSLKKHLNDLIKIYQEVTGGDTWKAA